MDYLHKALNLGTNDAVEVTLNMQANVMLLSDGNFNKYRAGQRFEYYGGLFKISPAILKPPRAGKWHLVIDLGGRSGRIKYSVRVI